MKKVSIVLILLLCGLMLCPKGIAVADTDGDGVETPEIAGLQFGSVAMSDCPVADDPEPEEDQGEE